MKENKKFICPDAYEITGSDFIEEIDSRGLLLRHKKSGARVLLLMNQDDNKVFSIGFRTPPKDSTGVAHIIEHTVLCGSAKFPSKDPFIELAKGSLNTFLNAMTFSDKTIFPVASCNDKDFQNLVDVYLDAVFHPNIYREEKIFRQEGWHYALECVDGEIAYNGVVYNEMKGVYSSPEQKLAHDIETALFPESVYGLESGGDPEVIPQLTYEEFLDFHRRYYHPSNSYIYLYGDMDMEEKLDWMDREYLSQYDMQPVDSEIKRQKGFQELRHAESLYSVTEGMDCKEKSYLAYGAVIGDSLDKELCLAFQILEYALLDSPGAPLKKALYDAEIGRDVLNHFDKEKLQPMFSIMVKETEPEKADEFRRVLFNTLSNIAEKGIGEKSLRAAINYFEFIYREADFGQFPKGLMYGIRLLDSWLYHDEKPFIYLHTNAIFAWLKGKIATGYFEGLIRTWLLENRHAVLLVMRPEPGLTEKKELLVAEHLKKYKSELSKEELEQMVQDTAALKAYQQEPSKKEDIEKIPVLDIADIKREPEPFYNTEVQGFSCPLLHHNVYTNGIGYFEFLFDVTQMDVKRVPYASFLTTLFGEMDTEHYALSDLSNEIDIHTGGMDTDLYVCVWADREEKEKKKEQFTVKIEVKVKALYDEFDTALSLAEELLFHTKLSDEKRLKEILGEERSRMQMHMVDGGHGIAVKRAQSYHSTAAAYEELISGIDYYRQIDEWYRNFNEKKEEMIEVFQNLAREMFDEKRLLVSFTADEKGLQKVEKPLKTFLEKISQNNKNASAMSADTVSDTLLNHASNVCGAAGVSFDVDKLPLKKKNEGFCTAGQVQYVARAGSFFEDGYEYQGSLRVLTTILSYDYLWNQVRVVGGAYGCMSGFGRSGNGYFVSYRDPNLEKTNEIFEKVWEYVRDFNADPRDMRKYIIGTISGMDTPLTPSAKGRRSLHAYLTGVTIERLQKEREQVLNADVDAIRELAPLVKSVLDNQEICVIGGAQKVKKNRELFMEVKELL